MIPPSAIRTALWTVTGGAGADSISTVSQAFSAKGAINTDKTNTVVTFANAAEFFTSGDVVDSISVPDGDGTILEIGGALKFDVTDDFDRLSMSGTGADRNTLATPNLSLTPGAFANNTCTNINK